MSSNKIDMCNNKNHGVWEWFYLNFIFNRVNGEEKLKRDWMFKLVGNEVVTIGKNDTNCLIKIEPYGGFSYQYSLEVNGKAYKTFTEQQAKESILIVRIY